MTDLLRRLEALLFISARPLSREELASACECECECDVVEEALRSLSATLRPGAHGVELREVGGGFTLAVAEDCAPVVRRFTGAERPDELTPALLETLAIVAYLEPVTRADVAEIRGVSSEWALSSLEERGLVEQRGRAVAPGAPLLYGTGERFLKLFGLGSLKTSPARGVLAPRRSGGGDQGALIRQC